MKDSHQMYNLFGQAYRSYHEWKKQEIIAKGEPLIPGQMPRTPYVDPTHKRLFIACVIGIIAIIGVEPVRVIYRKNFGEGAINMLSLVLCCLFFFIVGLWSSAAFAASIIPDGSKLAFEGPVAYLATAILFFWLGGHGLSKGIREHGLSKTNRVPQYYQGDPDLLAFLQKEGKQWTKARIREIEPLVTILLGISFCIGFSIIGGVVLIFAGLSSIIYSFMMKYVLIDRMDTRAKSKNAGLHQSDEFNDVNTD